MNHKISFVKFGLVGVVNTVIDFAVFVVLVRLFDWSLLPANILAYIFAVSNSYVLNRAWTFRSSNQPSGSLHSYAKFVSINSVGLIIGTTVIYILDSIMVLEAAKLVAVFFTQIWNYLASHFWIFNKEKGDVG